MARLESVEVCILPPFLKIAEAHLTSSTVERVLGAVFNFNTPSDLSF
jgi:hypothetical protein